MADFFPEQGEEPDLFGWVSEAGSSYTPVNSDRQLTNTALLGAMAYRRQQDDQETLQQVHDRVKGYLETGNENIVRDGIARTKRQAELNFIRELESSLPEGADLKSLMDQEREIEDAPLDPYALESEGVAQTIEQGAEDPTQAAILTENLTGYRGQRKNVIEQTQEWGEKIALLEQFHDEVETEYSAQAMPARVWDWIGGGIDFTGLFRSHQLGAPAKTNPFLNPGQNFQEQRDWYMSLPLEDFKRLYPAYKQAVRDNSGLLQNNQLLMKQTIEDTIQFGDSDLIDYNLMNAMNAGTSGALGTSFRMGKNLIRLSKAMGNRTGAASVASGTIMREAAGAESLGELGKAIPGADAVEESLASNFRPGGQPGVGIGGEVADQIESLKIIADDVANLRRTGRVSNPEELENAVIRTAERVENRYRGRKIVDLKNADEVAATQAKFAVDPDLSRALRGAAAHEAAEDIRLGIGPESQAKAFKKVSEAAKAKKAQGSAFTVDDKYGVVIEQAGKDVRPERAGWRPVKEGEVFQPGLKFRMNVKTGTQEVFEAGGPIARKLSIKQRGKAVADLNIEYNRGTQEINVSTLANIGPKAVRGITTQLKKMFPEAKTITGLGPKAEDSAPIETITTKGPEAPQYRVGIDFPYEVSKDLETGLTRVHTYIGNNSRPGGWLSKQGGLLAAKRMGFDPKDIEMHFHADQWYIKTTDIVPETMIQAPKLKDIDFPRVGPKGMYLKQMDSISPQVWNNERIQQVWARSGLQIDVINKIMKPISKLSKKQTRTLRMVAVLARDFTDPVTGRVTGKWFTDAEMMQEWQRITGEYPPDKAVLAWNAYKLMTKINEDLMELEDYIIKARRGTVTGRAHNATIGFDTGRINMYEVQRPDFGDRFFDVENGVHYSGQNTPLTVQQRWQTGNYTFLKVEGEPHWHNGEPIRNMMVQKRQTTIGPLERRQHQRRPGGNYEYAWSYFGKQNRTGKFSDGSDYTLNPKTLVTARTKPEIEEWAAGMERARDTYNKIADKANPTAREIAIIEETDYSYQRWHSAAQRNANDPEYLDMTQPFEGLFDGVEPKALTGMGTRTRYHNMSNPALTHTEQYYNSRNRGFNSANKELTPLNPDPHHQRAEVLDPLTYLNRGTATAAHTAAFADYHRMVVEEWVRLAEPYLKKGSWGQNNDPMHIFFNAELDPSLAPDNPKFFLQLDANRKVHKSFMGMREPNPTTYEYNARRFAAWVEGKGNLGRWAAAQAYKKTDKNPQAAVRAFVYDPWLGFHDIGSLGMQTQTAVAAMTMEPKFGLKAAAATTYIPLMLLNKHPGVWDFIAKGTQMVHGMAPAEFKQMVKALQDSDSMKVGGEMIQIQDYTGTMGGNAMMKGLRNFVRGGRWVQFLAERYNRMTAWQIAWDVVKRDQPNLAVGTPEFISAVSGQAGKFAFNMTKASQALWQTGWFGALPAQFASYQARMLEKMLPEMAGGDPLMSMKQRQRLWIGQAVLFGSKGILGGSALVAGIQFSYKQATGKDIPPDVLNGLIRGFYDTTFKIASGGDLDTDLAQRAGFGSAVAMYWEKVRQNDYSSALELMTGPSGTMITNFSETLYRINQYYAAEQVNILDPIAFERAATDVLQNIASTRRATKAYWIWKTGFVVNPKTHTPIFPATTMEGFAAFLGIPLRGDSERVEMFMNDQERREMVEDIANLLALNEREMVKALGGVDGKRDMRKYNALLDNTAAIMQSYRDDSDLTNDIIRRRKQILSITGTEMEESYQRMEKAGQTRPTGPVRGRF